MDEYDREEVGGVGVRVRVIRDHSFSMGWGGGGCRDLTESTYYI